MTDSILINYTGSDGQGIDAGVKVMNDSSDWGMYIRKGSNADYGMRIDSGGGNAFNIYSTTGGSTKSFGVNGGTGATAISGTESLILTLNPTANNYGGIWFKYGGVSKGMSVYNSGSMIYGGESGVGTKLQSAGATALAIDTSLNSIFTETVTVGTGTVATPNAAADDFVITGPGTTATGMTISNTSDSGVGTIFFGDSTSSTVAGIRYDHNTGNMAISAEDDIVLTTDGLRVGVGGVIASSSEKLTVDAGAGGIAFYGAGGSDTVSTMYLNNNDTTANTWQTYMVFADGSGNRGQMGIKYSTAALAVSGQGGIELKTGSTALASSTTALTIDSSQAATFAGDVTFNGFITVAAYKRITVNVPSAGGTWFAVSHAGNENWTWEAQSGSGSDDYLDVGIGGGTRAMSWHEDGKIGIGNSSPSSALTVGTSDHTEITIGDASANAQGRLRFLTSNNQTNFQIGFNYNVAGGLEFTRSSAVGGSAFTTPDMVITNAGDVGIGTNSPGAKLEVNSGGSTGASGDTDLLVQHSSAASTTAQIQILAGNTGYSNIYLSDTDSYSIGGFIYNHTNNSLTTRVTNQERMHISGGRNSSYVADGIWGATATPCWMTASDGSRKFLLGYQDNGSGLYAAAYGFETSSTDGLGNTSEKPAIILKNTNGGAYVFQVSNLGAGNFAGTITTDRLSLFTTSTDRATVQAGSSGATGHLYLSSWENTDEHVLTWSGANNGFYPQGASGTFSLGLTGNRWSNVYAVALTASGEVEGGSLDINGVADISGDATFAGNVDLTTDNKAIRLGSGGNLSIKYDGSNGKIENNTGHFYIINESDDKSIYFQTDDGSGGTTTYMKVDGVSEYTEFTKASKHMDGINAFFGSSADANIYHNGTDTWYFLQQADNGYIDIRNDDGSGGTTSYLVIDGNNELNRFYKRVQLEDNVKLTLGNITTPDLEIYHDGSNSYIQDTGTGSLKVCAANWHLMNSAATEYMATGTPNGPIILYYDNSQRMATATASVTNFSGGIDVKSTISGEDLTMELDHDTDNYSGTILNVGGGSLTAGKIYANNDGWEEADAGDPNATFMLGLCIGAAFNEYRLLLNGIYDTGGHHGFTVGSPLYISTTSGNFTATAPSGGDYARVVGYAISTSNIYFCPDNTWVLTD